MDTRIQKSISKFELKKEKKLLEKEKIEEELNEIEANLKQLYSLQEKQSKLQSAIINIINLKKTLNSGHSKSVLYCSKH